MTEQAETQTVTRKVLVRNSTVAVATHFGSAAVAFLTTPYVVHKLGAEAYGILAVVSALTGWAGLIDLNVKSGFSKYIAEYHASGARSSYQAVIGGGLAFYGLVSVVVLACAGVFGGALLRCFNVPESLMTDAEYAFICGVIGFCVTNILIVYDGVLDGLQRTDVNRLIGMAASILGQIAAVVALALGKGLRGVALMMVGAALANGLGTASAAFRLSPTPIGVRNLKLDFRVLSRLVVFGTTLQAGRVAYVVEQHLPKLLLAHFWNLRLVAFYQIGLRAATVVASIPKLLSAVIMPAASDLDARCDKDRLESLYERTAKYVATIAFPAALFSLVMARHIVGAWLGGGELWAVVWPLGALCFVYSLDSLLGPSIAIAAGLGRPQYQLVIALLRIVALSAAGCLVVPYLGLPGAIAATVAAIVCVLLFGLPWMHAKVAVSQRSFCGFSRSAYLKPAGAAVAAALITCGVSVLGNTVNVGWSRMTHALAVIVLGGIFGTSWALVIRRMQFFDAVDVQTLPLVRWIAGRK